MSPRAVNEVPPSQMKGCEAIDEIPQVSSQLQGILHDWLIVLLPSKLSTVLSRADLGAAWEAPEDDC